MNPKLLRNDIKYVVFDEIYQRFNEPKAKRKAHGLMENMIHCLARKGFDGVTLQMVARESGLTRPAIKYYFASLDELKVFSIKYVRLIFQKLAVDAMMRGANPQDMLSLYIDSCFVWIKNYKTHALVWLAFLHRCSQNAEMKALNTMAVLAGEERIQNLLQIGKEKGVFRFSNAASTAKSIQVLITGALVSFVSENIDEPESFQALVKTQCLMKVGC
jgi:AcrR family transcriptional regulator